MPKHDAGHGTQIVGFRVPQNELKTWQYFADKYKMSLTQFLVTIVESYLHPERPTQIPKGEGPVPEWVVEGVHRIPQYINLRLPREIVSNWDEACKQYYCTRIALLQQAVQWITGRQELRKPVGLVGVTIKNVLLNLITTLGSLDFSHIAAIFQDWEPASLIQMLGTLEVEGHIMRKGQETYVPVGGVDPVLGPRFVAGHHVLVADSLRTNPEEWDEMPHALLAQAAVEYLIQHALTIDKDFDELTRVLKEKIRKGRK
ncbi:MAG: hypothetical protein RBG13Loki_2639 [Promethearchaeota archaeon CR_4]|nr:MAG: hypothetical protein RBG13Loki_2639 [Candidatus Lokiarchaeota archaeon CR_4]